jgi:hypothetical protein
MFYVRFVWWLTQRANRWEVKRTYGDAGVYNHFDDVRLNGLQPLSSLVPLVLYATPLAGYLYFVMEVLPFSITVQTIILMVSLGGGWIVALVFFIRKAKRRRHKLR